MAVKSWIHEEKRNEGETRRQGDRETGRQGDKGGEE
jgi:hypothetical protein